MYQTFPRLLCCDDLIVHEFPSPPVTSKYSAGIQPTANRNCMVIVVMSKWLHFLCAGDGYLLMMPQRLVPLRWPAPGEHLLSIEPSLRSPPRSIGTLNLLSCVNPTWRPLQLLSGCHEWRVSQTIPKITINIISCRKPTIHWNPSCRCWQDYQLFINWMFQKLTSWWSQRFQHLTDWPTLATPGRCTTPPLKGHSWIPRTASRSSLPTARFRTFFENHLATGPSADGW